MNLYLELLTIDLLKS